MRLPEGPRANIEIKARLRDRERALRTAKSLGARDMGSSRQVDTYFRVPRGRLKLRHSPATGEQLVLYLRPDEPGPRRADYEVVPTPPGGRTRELLERMLGVEVEVVKVRHLLVVGSTRIHLDEVERLGDFLELEAVYSYGNAKEEDAARVHVDSLMQALGIEDGDLVPLSYRELLLSSPAQEPPSNP